MLLLQTRKTPSTLLQNDIKGNHPKGLNTRFQSNLARSGDENDDDMFVLDLYAPPPSHSEPAAITFPIVILIVKSTEAIFNGYEHRNPIDSLCSSKPNGFSIIATVPIRSGTERESSGLSGENDVVELADDLAMVYLRKKCQLNSSQSGTQSIRSGTCELQSIRSGGSEAVTGSKGRVVQKMQPWGVAICMGELPVHKVEELGFMFSLLVLIQIYGFSWVVLVTIVLIFKVFSYSPKKSANFQLVMRFAQGVAALGLVAVIALLVIFTELSIADLFASLLTIIPTGWAILCLAVTWKSIVRSLGLWDSVREFARMYDAGMGMFIFAPIAFLSWFPFISTFQSRLLFNQAFSRGLEICF
ncbi:hypothetical protein FF1_037424 [Malus domestica]